VNYVFDNERPIYVQLVEMLRIEIASGTLKKGERIPSVRELALMARVNPNTMQKALAELEDEKLVYTERTNGKFVTNDEKLLKQVKQELAKQQVSHYLEGMKQLGINQEEAIQYLQELGGK
jgi:DNA-binding transcriptional regulator YhcF (GntR family)